MPYDRTATPTSTPRTWTPLTRCSTTRSTRRLSRTLGNEFRALPPEEQIEDLVTKMMKLTSMRNDLSARLEAEEAPLGGSSPDAPGRDEQSHRRVPTADRRGAGPAE